MVGVTWNDNDQCGNWEVYRIDLLKNAAPYINNVWTGTDSVPSGSLNLQLPETVNEYGDIYQLKLYYRETDV